MPRVHRNGDKRYCGSVTVVSGQNSVYINGELVAVEGDVSSHGGGALISTAGTTYINGKKVIVKGDTAELDDFLHIPPWAYPKDFSADVWIGGTTDPPDLTAEDFPSYEAAVEAANSYWANANTMIAATINTSNVMITSNSPYWQPYPTF